MQNIPSPSAVMAAWFLDTLRVARFESIPVSVVTLKISSAGAAFSGSGFAVTTICFFCGEKVRPPSVLSSSLRIGMLWSVTEGAVTTGNKAAVLSLCPGSVFAAGTSVSAGTKQAPESVTVSSMAFSCMRVPAFSSAAISSCVIARALSVREEEGRSLALTLTWISPAVSPAPIMARSLPEKSLRLVHLYCSKSVLSPLSSPRSRPAPVTETVTRMFAFSTGFPFASTAWMVRKIRSLPSAFSVSRSAVRISAAASPKELCSSVAMQVPFSS